MSNNQNNEAANTVGIAAVLGVFMIIGFGITAIALALFMTLIAICVQFKPMTFQGQVITAKDGRRFVLFGLLGTLPCTALLFQLAIWLKVRIENDWVWAVFLLGYSFAALSLSWFVETFWGNAVVPNQPDVIDVTPQVLPQPVQPAKPYQFADWDDDDTDPYK